MCFFSVIVLAFLFVLWLLNQMHLSSMTNPVYERSDRRGSSSPTVGSVTLKKSETAVSFLLVGIEGLAPNMKALKLWTVQTWLQRSGRLTGYYTLQRRILHDWKHNRRGRELVREPKDSVVDLLKGNGCVQLSGREGQRAFSVSMNGGG